MKRSSTIVNTGSKTFRQAEDRSNLPAFSLMEIVVSVALLGLIVVLVLNIFPSSIVASHSASELVEAEYLAQSLLEETRSAAFSSLVVGIESPPSTNPKYQLQREVFVPPDADAGQTLGVRVSVTWQDKGKQRQLTREMWLSSVRS